MNALRDVLLWASRRRALGDWLERSSLSGRLVRRFVAGATAVEAMAAAEPLLERGYAVTFSALGEDVGSAAEAAAAVEEYQALLAVIEGEGIAERSKVAVKPTLLGLQVGEDLAARNLAAIAAVTARTGVGLELDMERSPTVEATLRLYRHGLGTDPALGVAIQAALRRSADDVAALIGEGIARVRLVKGAYAEPASVAYRGEEAVVRSMHGLVRALLAAEAVAGGARLSLATHDEAVIAATRTRAFRTGAPSGSWEVQMLYGVRPRLQARLLREGYPVRLYLPYGRHWYPYFMRRLAERPANLWFALRQVLPGG